jgi:hypothetical protein
MAKITKGEFLRLVINNFDAIKNIDIKEPNKLGIGEIKLFYDSKMLVKKDD